ncbi:MAG: DUF29 family protein [Rhodospirillaceae bacterium]
MATLYESDFYAWPQDQAARLKSAAAERVNIDLDWENLAVSWTRARKRPAAALSLPLARRPADCPWHLDAQVLDEDGLPPTPDQTA